jgi:hypothetical protein
MGRLYHSNTVLYWYIHALFLCARLAQGRIVKVNQSVNQIGPRNPSQYHPGWALPPSTYCSEKLGLKTDS